jgi:NAD(P)H dehydrogenase (quinone)
MARIAIIYYSTWGHIRKLAGFIKEGIESAGGQVDVYQIAETLPEEVLIKMHATPKSEDPIATPDTLTQYDAYLFGVPTRYGNQPAQWRAFWDRTGGLWATGALQGKYVSIFFSTSTPGGGQEATALNSMSTFAHQGMIFVPLGYKGVTPLLSNLNEVHGGSAWGAGTFTAPDSSRQPTELERQVATIQGKQFYETVSKVSFQN